MYTAEEDFILFIKGKNKEINKELNLPFWVGKIKSQIEVVFLGEILKRID